MADISSSNLSNTSATPGVPGASSSVAFPFNHVVIRASAGSGKTFALTNRFLKLLLCGVPPEKILATTFTRKAAGEILYRVLRRLGTAALHPENRDRFAKELFPDENRSLSEKEINDLLYSLVTRLNQLRIGTLDSFFIQLAGSFSLELGLPPGWTIAEEFDNSQLMNDAILLTMEKLGTSAAVGLMHLLYKGKLPVSITADLNTLITGLLATCHQSDEKIWKKLERRNSPETSVSQMTEQLLQDTLPLSKTTKAPDKRLVNAREALIQLAGEEKWSEFAKKTIVKSILSNSYVFSKVDFSQCTNLISAVKGLMEHVRAEIINDIVNQTEATAQVLTAVSQSFSLLKSEEGFYRFEDITKLLSDSHWDSGASQIAFRLNAETRHLLLDEFQDTSFDQWKILCPFVEGILEPPKNTGTVIPSPTSFFCVGDIKQAIYGWRGGLSGIFDKVASLPGVQLNQLDRNWRSSKVVIEVVNKVFSALEHCSIFQAPKLPDSQDAQTFEYHQQAIANEVAKTWDLNYPEHKVAPKNETLSGFCSFEVAPLYDKDAPAWLPNFLLVSKMTEDDITGKDDSSETPDELDDSEDDETGSGSSDTQQANQKRYLLYYTVDRIIEIHRQNPDATIGVLFRSNRMLGKIVALLRTLGIEASEEGGNPLTDTASVLAILSVLTLADHPGDTVALYHIASIPPLADHFKIDLKNRTASAKRISLQLREEIMTRSLGTVIEELGILLLPMCDVREAARMRQLIDLAFLYTGRRDRIDDFISFVKGKKVLSPSGAKIRALTIHRSKGLEFDIVILPELATPMTKTNEKVVFGRNPQTLEIETALRRVNNDCIAFLPDFLQKMFYDNLRQQLEESLNLFYVAMTRAVRQLVMIGLPSKTQKYDSLRWDNILRCCLGTDKVDPPLQEKKRDKNQPTLPPPPLEPPAPKIVFATGNSDWSAESKRITTAAVSPKPDVTPKPSGQIRNPFDFVPPPRPLVEMYHSPSQKTGRKWLPHSIFQYGTLIHRCFEEVQWLDEKGRPSRDRLQVILQSLYQMEDKNKGTVEELLQRKEQEINGVIDQFYSLCDKPNIRKALSLGTLRQPGNGPVSVTSGLKSPDWDVETERPYIETRSDGVLSRGIIDRLVLLRSEGKVIGAEIIDYKTDRTAPQLDKIAVSEQNGSKDFLSHYFRQLREYERIVRKWYRLDKNQVSKKLLFVTFDLVVDVPPDSPE